MTKEGEMVYQQAKNVFHSLTTSSLMQKPATITRAILI